MEEKKADNRVIENKARIKEIDSQIDVEKDKGKQLDDLEEVVTSLNNNIARCLELLGASIQGNNSAKKFDAYQTENKINYKKTINNIESHRDYLKNNISRLNSEKDELIDEIKEEE